MIGALARAGYTQNTHANTHAHEREGVRNRETGREGETDRPTQTHSVLGLRAEFGQLRSHRVESELLQLTMSVLRTLPLCYDSL